MEDAQKKAKRAGMPIADVELVMTASAAVLAAQYFPRKVDDWEGLPAVNRTWRAWKVAFRLAHLKRQPQLQASGGVCEPLGGAPFVLPAPAATINRLGTALDNLALAAANNTTVLQQLTAANLVLTTSNATLTAANKKLLEALAKIPATPTNRSLGITVGHMAIVSASFTRVRVHRAATRPQGTRTRQRPPTQWEVATPTRDGTHVAPDGVGLRI